MQASRKRPVESRSFLPEGWRLIASGFQQNADRPTITRLEIEWNSSEGEPPQGGLTHAVLRSVRLTEVIDSLDQALEGVDEEEAWRAEFAGTWGSGHKRLPDRQYALLAFFYDQAVRYGVAPRRRLSELMGDPPAQTVDIRIATARRRGLLGKPAPGRAGGGMTQQAIDLLSNVAKPPKSPRSRRKASSVDDVPDFLR